ncbi:MAG: YgfZ/GcvT domain-containing protein [Aggregatilineales bacterium]
MTLLDTHKKYGAVLADDGIPLHYGDFAREYRAGQTGAILLDRSHEGRLRLTGKDACDLINRMSTNKLVNPQNDAIDIAVGEGRGTVFINATGRILERVMVYRRADDLILITEPGHAERFKSYLQRHIFFNDDVQVQTLHPDSAHLALHGVQADAIMEKFIPDVSAILPLHSIGFDFEDAMIFAARRKSIIGKHWMLLVPHEISAAFYEQLMAVGGVIPMGSLTYNTLRIFAGRPAAPELNTNYLPLEVGLWDEVSFDKGCYTGQEIIARMESRQRLAKTLVQIQPENPVSAAMPVFVEDKQVGIVTSSVATPDGEHFALAVIKTDFARVNTALKIGDEQIPARLIALPGVQAPYLSDLIRE